ncbi:MULTISPECIES: MBG domain-containing protein [unclassified Myroides]|uniref:MBG domain-containing protein n=1 Tax=unclassified Myroides TaxID=2642485 RepID=UPI003D2F8E00
MKKTIHYLFFFIFSLQCSFLQAQPYQSLEIDGYNADVIANGVGAVASSTTHDIDNAGHYLLADDWKLDANQSLSGTGLPRSGRISSAHIPGMEFLLQNYSANNSIRLSTTVSTVTSNLAIPAKTRKLFVLTTAGLTSTALDVTVIFEDDTTEVFSSRVPDWYNGTSLPVVYKNFGRLTGASILEKPTDNPRLYQLTLHISKQNQLKKVKQIKFLRPISFEGVLNIFAVSAELLDDCPSPEFVEFSELTMNSVVATVDLPVLPATTYQYELRTSGLPGSGSSGLVKSQDFSESNSQITFTDLANATAFSLYVRSFCSDTNQGYWKGPFTFTTLCSAVNTPYKVPFDTVDAPNAPACTTILNANEDDYTWTTERNVIGFEGPVLKYRYNPTQAADDWFFTRGINVTSGETYRLRFKYRDKRFNEKLRVSLGKFAYPEAMTTEIFNVDTGGTDQVTDKLIEFTANETGVLYIGFQVYSLADQYYFYLGDIEVTQSSCHRLLWWASEWVCEGGPVTLEAQANYGTLRWYASRTSTEVLGEGSTFVTPPLTESRSYYVKSYFEDSKGGKQSLSTNSNDSLTNANWGISFDLLDPGTIKSTTVYASQSGSIRVSILNSSGREVYVSDVIAINAAGSTVPIIVPLNAELNAGRGYKMILKEVNNAKLFVDQTVLFPMYDSHTSLRVTSSLMPVENRATYAYFFELLFQRACSSDGVVLDASVIKAVAPIVDQAMQHFCKSSNPTLADIAITGTNIRWYANETGGVELPNTTPLVHNTTYYASQLLSACESPRRTAVKVVLEEAHLQTSGINVHYNYGTDSETVGTSIYNALGSTVLQWFTEETGGLPVDTPAFSTLAVGSYDYWVSGIINGCESARSRIGLIVRPVSIWVTAQPTRKVYGEEDPALLYRVSGLVNNDELTGTLTRAPGEDVDTYVISRGTLAASSNYILNVDNANFRILPATLTVTAADKTKVYGEEDPAFTYTVTGLKWIDSAASALRGNLARTGDEAVGNYSITQGTLEATENYTLVFEGADFTIRPATISIMAHPKAKDYGAPEPLFTYTTVGMKRGEDSSTIVTGHLTRTGTEDVGIYTIEPGTLAANANYIIDYVSAYFTINPEELTVTAEAKTKIYGEADPTLTYAVTGLQRSEDASTVFTGSLTRVAGEAKGLYAIEKGSLSANANYTFNYVGDNLTIGVAELTVTANPQTKTYGEADPALTYTVSGLKNGDQVSDVLTGSLERVPGGDIGMYGIGQGSLALTSSDYTLNYIADSLSITPAVLTVTATPQTKTYGEADPALTYTVSGLQNNEEAAAVLTGSLTRVAGEAKGLYAIEKGSLSVNANYSFTYEGADLEIQAAELTVTAEPKNKAYGETDPALTYTVSGLKNNEDASTVFTGSLTRVGGESVGNYAIQQGSLVATANYNLVYEGADLAITAAELIVTADSQTKVYGEVDPVLTYTVSGLQWNDDIATVMQGTLSRESGESVGVYRIEQGNLTTTANYTLAFVGAHLAITPIELRIAPVPNQTKVYGQADPVLVFTVSGLSQGDTAENALIGTLGRTNSENVGLHSYTLGSLQAAQRNYYLVLVNEARFEITAAPIAIVVNPNQQKRVGQADPVLAYTVTGLQRGDYPATVMMGQLERETGESVGMYAIAQGSLYPRLNYTIQSFTADVFEIKKGEITGLTLPSQSFVYDGEVKRLQVEGLLADGAVITYENNEQTQVGRYTVAATIDYGSDYEPLRLLGLLTLISAEQHIRFTAPALVVMEDTPTLQLQATASSGLPISYTIDDPTVAVVDDEGKLRFLQPGVVTVTAHQEGDSNYKAATPVAQTIEVTSNDASIWDLEIDGVKYGKIEGQLQVVLSCEYNQEEVHFVVTTQKGAVVQPSHNFIVPVPAYGRYEQVITVQAQNGRATQTYTIVIDKRMPTENLVFQKYGNVLLVNNNKQTNGGYVFSAYEWFKNGESMGKKQFYSAGSDAGTTFEASAVYEVELTLHNGQKIRSCPIVLENKQGTNWAVYPNPVEKNTWLSLRLDDKPQEAITYAIYSIKGQLIKRGQVDPTRMGIEIPATAATGSYYLVLKTADRQEGIQFIIK